MFDEEREAKLPCLPLETPPEASLGLSPSALLESVNKKLTDLADQRHHILCQMYAYKRLRNSVVPINRLPQELLADVFLLVTEDGSYQERVLDLSRVFTQWRTVVLTTPRLWTHIPLRQRRLAELFLVRSGNTHLHYRVDGSTLSSTYPVLQDLQGMLPLSRTKTLEVEAANEQELLLVFDLLAEPAPFLETLSLQLPAICEWVKGVGDLVIRTTLFDDAAPKLRILDLDVVHVYWTSSIFANLTKLELRNQKCDMLPDVDTFLDVLERTPQLESLLYHCWDYEIGGLPRYVGPTPNCPRVITLPELKRLMLEILPSAWTSSVLGSLQVTARTRVDIVSTAEVGQVDFPLDMLPADLSRIPALSNIRSMEIEQIYKGLKFSLSPVGARHPRIKVPQLGSLELRRADSMALALRDAFQKLDIRHLESLTIREHPRRTIVAPHIWPTHLQMTKHLQQLQLIDIHSPDILTALRNSCDDNAICPRLRALALQQGFGGDAMVPELEAYINHLSKEGRPLATVTLTDVGFSTDAILRLKSMDVKVDVWRSVKGVPGTFTEVSID
ncbi:hypothetical protein EVJ58_g9477 [Rhodofomes roseus]|uniref:F-box domain-containing protein n=1 Tax=Rhodofomes roseus TaxID=34475 RepID=A0A4Y9XUF2_9APHY|nr:hypothetical protein EVJ58_g9477 [Rhodofomes roseus]